MRYIEPEPTVIDGDRISTRVAIPAVQVELGGVDILALEAMTLMREVQAVTGGAPVAERTFYITYEEVVGQPAPRGGGTRLQAAA